LRRPVVVDTLAAPERDDRDGGGNGNGNSDCGDQGGPRM
jgi:hypothetical protein